MLPVNEVINGNCAEVMATWHDDCIDLTVTSPPYDNLRDYEGYVFNFAAIAAQLWRITKLGGVVVWVVGDATVNGSETGTSFRQALYFMQLGFNLHDTMIYAKKKMPMNDKRYEQEFEYMFVFTKGKIEKFNPIMIKKTWKDNRKKKTCGRYADGSPVIGFAKQTPDKVKGNIWWYSVGGGNVTKDKIAYEHPAIYPEALARDHIISWSNPGDIVLDPMCGSGTTLKMAKQTGRRFIGIDISENYCAIARKRIEGAQPPLFVDTVTPSNKTSTTTGLSPEGKQPELFTTASSQDASG